MFSFLVQTLFALQGSTKRTGSYSSHLSRVCGRSPTLIILKPHERERYAFLLASPILYDETKHLEPTFLWLQEKLNLDAADLDNMVEKDASFLGFSLESQKESVAWLQKRLDMDDQNLRKLVQRFPPVLGMSVTDNLEPKLLWLKTRLDMDDKSLSKLVQNFPSVLSFGVADNLEPKLSWLENKLSLDNESLRKLVRLVPAVLVMSVEENLKQKCTWLQERLGMDDKGLSELVQRCPQVLGCNIEANLEPTIKFYEDCVGEDAARLLIVEKPRLLSASLENRLTPRLAEVREAGVPVDKGIIARMAVSTAERWSTSMVSRKKMLLKTQLRIARITKRELSAE